LTQRSPETFLDTLNRPSNSAPRPDGDPQRRSAGRFSRPAVFLFLAGLLRRQKTTAILIGTLANLGGRSAFLPHSASLADYIF
jgi:hypothetical protein